jgi:hypothetical protein
VFRPTLFRSAFVFALLAVSLDRWGAIWAVVAGVIAALLFIGGVIRFALDLYRRPRLEIEVGSGVEFDKIVASTDEFARAAVRDNSFNAAYIKVIRVIETKGRSRAKSVALRIIDVDPPNPGFRSAPLRWTDGKGDEVDIQPDGHKEAVGQFVVLYTTPAGTEAGASATPPILEHAPRIDFTLEVMVDGRKHKSIRMRVENPWPDPLFNDDALGNWAGDWPDPIPFPTFTRLS